ncbi:NADH-quinone oxidoreductase subunit K [Haloechinothrix halophila]|uniref:NADH-quinone oxidoreductase subunit K n=1 Tax=Haloechinothrix halophila TaxID=1069073 RepID=UPI000411D366|nr:NADH-quinone oxidoreductase subunit K [Haloechinothrix halophila]
MPINTTLVVALAVIYSAGFYLLMQRSLMRVLLGIVLVGHGANLFLQAAGGPAGEPATAGTPIGAVSDPLPQAMALTAIVITFAVTVLLLALAYRSSVLLNDDEVRDDVEDRRIRQAPESEDEPASVISLREDGQ